MKIVVENSSYSLHNWGDVSMLEIALERLRVAYPEAELHVLTRAPAILHELAPDVSPILISHSRPRTLAQQIAGPRWTRSFASKLGRSILPRSLRSRRHPRMMTEQLPIREAIETADILVATGGGYLTTVFPSKLENTLALFELANQRGLPIAMFGQGLGPFQGSDVVHRLRDALRSAEFVSLRERRASTRWMESFGIAQQSYAVTGDDAIELASRYTKPVMGDSLGVNLRIAPYSNVDQHSAITISSVIASFTKEYEVPLRPIPIAATASYSDAEAINSILGSASDMPHGSTNIQTLPDLLHTVGTCRLVLAGSYHAAVFALSQGIPVVAVSGSDYYNDKFFGLADMFSVDGACTVLQARSSTFTQDLQKALRLAWEDAPHIRPSLKNAVAEQVSASQEAYRTAILQMS